MTSTVIASSQIMQQLAFLAARLPAPPARVLDAGCGRGALAATLSAQGYDVTAIDNDPQEVAAATSNGIPVVEADITDYDDRPFDVVLFSLSLHHVADLYKVVTHARDLLEPGGILIADEFAWECADRSTAAWFYDTRALLDSAGLTAPGKQVNEVADPLQHWVHRHRVGDPMHTGAAMTEAIAGEFELRESAPVPYLHRYLGGFLGDNVASAQVFLTLQDIERRRVADGSLAAVGLQLVAQAAL